MNMRHVGGVLTLMHLAQLVQGGVLLQVRSKAPSMQCGRIHLKFGPMPSHARIKLAKPEQSADTMPIGMPASRMPGGA